MNDLITLELKQNQSGHVNANGDYSTVLIKPIDIEEGDEISISKVFIDTADQAQTTINVPEDLNFTFSGKIYNTNWNIDGKAAVGSGAVTPDCKKYVLCTQTDSQVAVSGELIESIHFKFVFDIQSVAPFWGDVTTTWEYKDLEGRYVQYHLFVPKLEVNPIDPTTENQTLNVGVVCEPNTFKLISPSLNVLSQKPYSTQIIAINKTEVQGGTKIYTPTIYSKKILIEKGSYTPEYFAKYVTDNLIRNEYNATNPADTLSPSKNTFMFPSNDLSSNQFFVDSETGTAAFSYPVTVSPQGSYWVGSSQLALQFADNRFSWSNLHMPLYDNAGNINIQYIGTTYSADTYVPVTNNSGIFWNSVTTDSKNPKLINFFTNILGFDFAKTTPSYNIQVKTIGDDAAYVYIYDWNNENWTGALNAVDIGIMKNATFYNIQAAKSLATITSEVQSIYANDIFSSPDFVFGYFQVAIESVFKNLLVGNDIKSNISAIISRYYESNSYATGNVSDAVRYIHKGSPVQLSSLGVRILDSDGNLASQIGEDNSVYISVIKAQQPPAEKK